MTRPARITAGLLLLALLTVPALLPADDALDERDRAMLRMIQLAEAGHVPQARQVLFDFLDTHPGDTATLYNIACLDTWLGDLDAALAHLEEAFAGGYVNFVLARNDRFLQRLQEDPRFETLVERYQLALDDRFRERAIVVDEGYPETGIPLHPVPGRAAHDDLDATLAVDFDREALRIEVRVRGDGSAGGAPIWEGGRGLLVNVIHPLSPDDYESLRYFSFAVDGRPGEASSWRIGRHGSVDCEPAPALAAGLRTDGDAQVYALELPWDELAPYAPPLDQELGLNVFYLGDGARDSRRILSLMEERLLSFEGHPHRRYVPLSLYDSDRSRAVLRGRLYERLVETPTAELQLAYWSPEGGEARFTFVVESEQGLAFSSRAPQELTTGCEPEINLLDATIDMTGLPEGTFRIRTHCTLPDGTHLSEAFPFTRFPSDWLETINARIFELPQVERDVLLYRIHKVGRRFERRDPLDGAGDLLADYREVVGLVEQAESGAGVLPASGFFQAGFTGEDGAHRSCALWLPYGHRKTGVTPLVVLPPEPGVEAETAREIGRLLGRRNDIVVVVPQSDGDTSLKVLAASANSNLAVRWARNAFAADTVLLVGAGGGRAAAEDLLQARPDFIERALLDLDGPVTGDALHPVHDRFSGRLVLSRRGESETWAAWVSRWLEAP